MHPDDVLGPRVRTMQIIVFALLAGGVTALVIFATLPRTPGPLPPTPLVTYLGLACAVVATVFSFMLPSLVIAGARKRIVQGTFGSDPRVPIPPDDAGKLLAVYTTALIIGGALLEGPTYFLLIAYYLEGQIAGLVAAGALMGVLAARFPTQARVRAWLDRQLDLLAQERQAGA
jgi:hypothetical protein